MICVICIPTCVVDLGNMSDDALVEIAKLYDYTGNRETLIHKLRDRIQVSTYDEIIPIFASIRDVVNRHGQPELVRDI